ncbi:mandelate racemase/muconate lactonizing enzyme family protein [Devosia rhodophyticola]|uniref:Mandelate racemase/muconate lactonizing enzyme family protein n=1 Tax=Devosia rhodophyticola TaxID=3026423 RepID=A0ABY7YV03_9HYPH|nr:mandelate racemase/muconate lactonizing enzyme family protein [Devosia rhodophyticola]WDR05193.1 mandelate racemase/muconate lactonizing enzyme family protein [Devosia rhodophyticola]
MKRDLAEQSGMNVAQSIDRIEVFALACAVEGGPVSTLALMPVRTGLLIKLTSSDSVFGWGEAWSNYPPKGNLNKLALLEDPIVPAFFDLPPLPWHAVRPMLEQRLHRMVIHTGESGPFAHCFAAIDMAMADLAARRGGISLAGLLGAGQATKAQVYASSPDVSDVDALPERLRAAGHTGVKIKIGFDGERDLGVLSRFRKADGAGLALYVDANQNWSIEAGLRNIAEIAQFEPGFVEEAILADTPVDQWREFAKRSALPLAAGENIAGLESFNRHVDAQLLSVVQPDVAKWGGVSGAIAVGKHALVNGAGCTLHYMGTVVGLATSLHTLAAIGGDGRVELDFNPNPLRTDLGAIDLVPVDGFLPLPEGPGIGFEPDPAALTRFAIATLDIQK